MSVDGRHRESNSGSAAEARVYHLLGTLYLEPPDRETLDAVAVWADRWLESEPPRELRAALSPLANVESGAVRLNEEFTRLFRGVVPNAPDPPYESLYRDGELGGEQSWAVRQEYRAAGVDVAPESGELADHLGLELHFVAALLDDGRGTRAETFLAEHPRQFIDDLARAVRRRDPDPFYEGVLGVTEFVLADPDGGR